MLCQQNSWPFGSHSTLHPTRVNLYPIESDIICIWNLSFFRALKMRGKRLSRAHDKRHSLRTNKIIDRLGYAPAKHKRKERRKMIQKLQVRVMTPVVEPEPKSCLKFGSFNINGMDLEVNWVIHQLISSRSFDEYFVKLRPSLNYLAVTSILYS